MRSPPGIHKNDVKSTVDYLVVGHIAKDLTPTGHTVGGTVAFAGRTAQMCGLRVGVLTSYAGDVDLSPLRGLHIQNVASEATTTFENRYTSRGREQNLRAIAQSLNADAVPQAWQATPIVHLGPIAAEIDFDILQHFPGSFLGITPQGWLRRWDENGQIRLIDWENIRSIMPYADVVVLSREDLGRDAERASLLAEQCKLLVVTEGAEGASVYSRGEIRRFPAPRVTEVDPTGAGDIFAAAFFIHFQRNRDPWRAARVANDLAAISVTRQGTDSTPTKEEIQTLQAEVRR